MNTIRLACVASLSARVRREKLGREQEKKGMSNFRAIARLETLAKQATITWKSMNNQQCVMLLKL